MSLGWEKLIDDLRKEGTELVKSELKSLIGSMVSDVEGAVKEQGEQLERYLSQLASSEITKDQFEGYVKDLKDLLEMKALEMSVRSKARVQRVAKKIEALILDKFLSLL